MVGAGPPPLATTTAVEGGSDALSDAATLLDSGSGPSQGQALAGATSDDAQAGATGSKVGAGAASGGTVRPPSHQEIIVFLCPNGHKLNTPKRLAGKIGKCPHCGVKFQIPAPDEHGDESEDELDDTVTEDPLQQFGDGGSSAAPLEFEEFERDQYEGSNTQSGLRQPFESRANAGSGVPGGVGQFGTGARPTHTPAAPRNLAGTGQFHGQGSEQHSLPQLLARLWAEREHGGVIELHLSGGAMLAPEWFDANLSSDTHGLFAAQAADGTVTMTVVPWDEVIRVVVRGVVGLPDGMFE
jgi:hypothetical protein